MLVRGQTSWVIVGALCLALAAVGIAQTNDERPRGAEIVTLGTRGGPLPSNDRAQCANLLIVNRTLYLIDAGDGVTRRIGQAGEDFRRIGTIFITHPHSDHTSGLAALLSAEWDFQRRDAIDVYGGGVEGLVRGAIAFLTPNAEIRWSEGKKIPMADVFRGHDVRPGVMYQDANVKVTAVENTHFHFTPDSPGFGKYQSYAYRFETPSRIVVFTGDTGRSDAVTDLAKNADVLVAEVSPPLEEVVAVFEKNGSWDAMTKDEQDTFVRHVKEEHLTAEDLGRMAAKAGVRTVVMTHFGPTADPEHDYQRLAEAAAKYYSGRVLLAKDLMRF